MMNEKEVEAWMRGAMSVIAPLSEQPCTGINPEDQAPGRTCLTLGITGRGACLPCRAKHFRENGVEESRQVSGRTL